MTGNYATRPTTARNRLDRYAERVLDHWKSLPENLPVKDRDAMTVQHLIDVYGIAIGGTTFSVWRRAHGLTFTPSGLKKAAGPPTMEIMIEAARRVGHRMGYEGRARRAYQAAVAAIADYPVPAVAKALDVTDDFVVTAVANARGNMLWNAHFAEAMREARRIETMNPMGNENPEGEE